MWYDPYASGYAPEGNASVPAVRAGSDCGCGEPRGMMPPPGPGPGPGLPGPGLFPPGPGPGPGPGPFPPGPGPFPPGPGPFPPGPGPFPPGPGPFPPGPGPFPPGPGPFPPGPGPFPPGPGPFPPGPGPFPPGPGPFPPPPFPPGPGPFPPPPFPIPGPFPIPFPLPIPVPFPAFVTVVINGGIAFPWVTNSYRIRFFPGITIQQALASTGNVRFGLGGQIIAVDGIAIGGGVDYHLLLNGRRIPQSLIYFPLQPNDVVALELRIRGFGPREDEAVAPGADYEQLPYASPESHGEYRPDEQNFNTGEQ